eukprot:5322202-Prymnesium_polylepis.1
MKIGTRSFCCACDTQERRPTADRVKAGRMQKRWRRRTLEETALNLAANAPAHARASCALVLAVRVAGHLAAAALGLLQRNSPGQWNGTREQPTRCRMPQPPPEFRCRCTGCSNPSRPTATCSTIR